jgi:phosphatidylglycerophosphate synthase
LNWRGELRVVVEEYADRRDESYSALRFIADMLTLTRMAIAAFIICLGLFIGPEALRAAIIAVLVGWMTDVADGPIARSSGSKQTWVARLDIPADLALVFSFFLFLVITGLYPVLPAIAIVAVGAFIVLWRPTEAARQMVTAPVFALPIVLSFYAGWLVGSVYVVFLATILIFKWDKVSGYAREARSEAAELSSDED